MCSRIFAVFTDLTTNNGNFFASKSLLCGTSHELQWKCISQDVHWAHSTKNLCHKNLDMYYMHRPCTCWCACTTAEWRGCNPLTEGVVVLLHSLQATDGIADETWIVHEVTELRKYYNYSLINTNQGTVSINSHNPLPTNDVYMRHELP